MTISDKQSVSDKYVHLKKIFKQMQRVMVAFSGGVDSTLLLKVAVDVLGVNVLAVTAVSETMADREKEEAEALAKVFKVNHMLVKTHELDIPEFIKNEPDKCYICKKSRFSRLIAMARDKKYPYVIDGENIDDAGDYRPGTRAARELGVRSPLKEANLTKSEIRLLSKQLDLPTWDKPALACLASRIPYDDLITKEKLGQIDAGETFLRRLGFSHNLRVRHGGDTARIELAHKDIPEIVKNRTRNDVIKYFKALGFQWITLDMEGYHMGSLNRVIPSIQKDGHRG